MRAAKHSRRRRECFAALGSRAGARNRGPDSGGQHAEIGQFCTQNRANFAVPPAAFRERQSTHAGGVSVLRLSERAPAPGKFGPFLGVTILQYGSLPSNPGRFCRAPRGVLRAAKHSRRRRECFAALGTRAGARQNLPVSGGHHAEIGKVGDRFQNIAIISVIPNMVKAGYRG